MKLSLRTKLMSTTIILIAIPLVVLGTISYMMTSSSMKNTIEQQMRDTTSLISQSISNTVDSTKNYIDAISRNDTLAQASQGTAAAVPEAYNYLAEVQKSNDNLLESLVIVNASGKGVVSSDKENESVDLSDRDYVKTALSGTEAVSDVLLSKISGNEVICVASPLSINGKTVGVLVGTVKFDSITKAMSQVKIGKKGYAFLLSKDGTFVYHPDSSKILKDNLYNTSGDGLKALTDKMKAGTAGDGYYTYQGARKFMKFMPVGNWTMGVTDDYNDYMSSAINIRNSTLLIIILSMLAAFVLVYLNATMSIIRPIKDLESLMSKAGDGDLTVKSSISSGDEIQTLGEYFNQMIDHQLNTISHVRKKSEDLAAASQEISASAEQIGSASQEVASNIQEVASNAENQSGSVVETSEVLVQLSSLVKLAQNKAIATKGNSDDTTKVANHGREKVKATIEAMDTISRSAGETGTRLSVLEELSQKVGGIIDTINSISSQTNLLALNAAIEAARAGEHGKGFTVVAEEVRKLSEQSNTGANEISALVKEMVLEIDKAVESMESSKHAIENGVSVADETDKAFVNIIEAVDQIVTDVNQIVDITNDEVASSEQIVKLIDTVATITETTTSSSEEVAAAAEEQSAEVENLAAASESTSSMAVDLNNLVEKFKI